MQQIFDWMRNAPLNAFKTYDGTIAVELSEVQNLISEAEAKWESECCEWNPAKTNSNLIASPHMALYQLSKEDLRHIPYCPFCGKPIKISEVE